MTNRTSSRRTPALRLSQFPTLPITVALDDLINALSKARRATQLTRVCLQESDTTVQTTGAEDQDKDMGAAILDVLDEAHDALASAHPFVTNTAYPKGGTR